MKTETSDRKKVIGVYRAARFSPNSVENDRMIMELVLSKLSASGMEVMTIGEELLENDMPVSAADLVLSMARSDVALRCLYGKKVINSTEGVRICSDRLLLREIMRENYIPCPDEDGDDGVWLKRAQGTAEVAEDTVYCCDEKAIMAAMDAFRGRNIDKVLRQAHVKGDLVKFYGVAQTDFLYDFYPTDAGRSKFGCEIINGAAQHFHYDKEALKRDIDRLAGLTGVLVYGGDAIVKADGSYVIIDFNDWPTFSPCREEAAEKIKEMILNTYLKDV